MAVRSLFTMLFFLPVLALAEPRRIAGPDGPLEGELLFPRGAQHIVLIIPGSGPINRDGNGAQVRLASDTYRLLAEGLAAEGIASLRVDKRGMFGSKAAISNPNAITIAGYADDARRWVAFAADLAPCVWIAGHSEGGLVALVAAESAPKGLCGLILLAAPGRPVGQLLIEQLRVQPLYTLFMPEIEGIVRDLEAGRPRDASRMNPILRPFFSVELQRYMINLFSYDPAEVASRWRGRTLILQGDADIQVTETDAALLGTAMPQARQVTLTGGTHMLKADKPGNPLATYVNPALPLHEAVIPAIRAFIETAAEPE